MVCISLFVAMIALSRSRSPTSCEALVENCNSKYKSSVTTDDSIPKQMLSALRAKKPIHVFSKAHKTNFRIFKIDSLGSSILTTIRTLELKFVASPKTLPRVVFGKL